MHAMVLDEFGGPEVMAVRDMPVAPTPPGFVRVELRASALNWHDVLVRRGQYQSPLPHVLGADGAGVRADTREEVIIVPSLFWGSREAAPGADWEILGDRRWGTSAEAVLVPQDSLAPKPSGWSWAAAAALPLVGLTVYRALVSRGRLCQGESLLVLGASGGVATMSVQLARAIGARAWVTSSSRAKIEQAVELGASGGVLYTEADWPERARALSPDGEGFDVVLDSVGTWSQALEAARPGGRVVVLGASAADSVTLLPRPFYFGQYELIGTTMGSPRDFAGLHRLVSSGALEPPVIAATYRLDEAVAAHVALEAGAAFGKITLDHT